MDPGEPFMHIILLHDERYSRDEVRKESLHDNVVDIGLLGNIEKEYFNRPFAPGDRADIAFNGGDISFVRSDILRKAVREIFAFALLRKIVAGIPIHHK